MSVRIMGEIWGLALPREQKYVLLSLADHADHEGCHVYPSLGLIAWKTDYSERQIRRVMAELEKSGVLIPTNRAIGQVTEYRIDLSSVTRKESRTANVGRPASGNKPIKPVNKPLDILSQANKPLDILTETPGHFDTYTPDIFDTCSYSLYEPSIEPPIEPNKTREIAPVVVEGFIEKSADNSAKKPVAKKTGYDADMLAFWEAYPLKGRASSSKFDTQQAWRRMSCADRVAARAGLDCALKVDRFCSYPRSVHTWLRSKAWETFTDTFMPEIIKLEATEKREAGKPYGNRNEIPSARTVTAAAPRQIGVAERDRLRREAKEAAGPPC